MAFRAKAISFSLKSCTPAFTRRMVSDRHCTRDEVAEECPSKPIQLQRKVGVDRGQFDPVDTQERIKRRGWVYIHLHILHFVHTFRIRKTKRTTNQRVLTLTPSPNPRPNPQAYTIIVKRMTKQRVLRARSLTRWRIRLASACIGMCHGVILVAA